ncbi:MAG: hypothetical protein GY810_25110 [Aureispira sp.]|nr:hypothetical protein [Aureispira sp.]
MLEIKYSIEMRISVLLIALCWSNFNYAQEDPIWSYIDNWEGEKITKLLGDDPDPKYAELATWAYHSQGNYNEVIWYGKIAVEQPELQRAETHYIYAQALMQGGFCNKALEQYRAYWGRKAVIKPRYKDKARSCDNDFRSCSALKGKSTQIEPVRNINTKADEFAPMHLNGNLLYLQGKGKKGSRERLFGFSAAPYTKTYAVNSTSHTSTKEALKGMVSGQACMPKNTKELYYVKEVTDPLTKGTTFQLFYIQNYKKNTKPKSFTFNSDKHDIMSPTVSNDGNILIFASNSADGGEGGMDLYASVCEYAPDSSRSWLYPVNLGKVINTEGDEITPFLYEDSVLYFASDGHAGLGGFDIFESSKVGKEWLSPRHMGDRINSPANDLGLVLKQYTPASDSAGYFSSDRKGGAGGFDIYQYNHYASVLNVQFKDKKTNEPLAIGTAELVNHHLKPINCITWQGDVQEKSATYKVPQNIKVAIKGTAKGYKPGVSEVVHCTKKSMDIVVFLESEKEEPLAVNNNNTSTSNSNNNNNTTNNNNNSTTTTTTTNNSNNNTANNNTTTNTNNNSNNTANNDSNNSTAPAKKFKLYIEGTVQYCYFDNPIKDADVTLYYTKDGKEKRAFTSTDPKGVFVFNGKFPAGKFKLVTSKRGYRNEIQSTHIFELQSPKDVENLKAELKLGCSPYVKD